jgi:hypothetical protein
MKLPTLTLLLFLGVTLPLGAASTVPTLLSYQGSVTDSAGVPIGNSAAVNRTVLFKLYSSSTGGTPIWAESQVVTISGGAFSVLIGNGTGISGLTGPSSPASPVRSVVDIINSTANEGVYLGVSVSDGTAAAPAEISPRQRLVSAAYAARATVAETVAAGGITTAAIADGQITAQKLGSGIVDHSKIATSAVQSNSILDGTIVAADIAAGAITSDKLSGSIGLWQTGSTGINYINGNVGIGTNSPSDKLTIGSGGWINFAAADGVSSGIKGTMAGNDGWQIYGSGSKDNGALIIKTDDNSNEPIKFYQSGSYRGGIASDGYWETGENMSIRINGNYNGAQADANLSMGTSGYFSINTYNTTQNRGKWRAAIYDGDSNWDYSSDVRFKQDIVDAEPMLDSLMQVRFRRFHWKGGDASDPLMFGVIAQELEPIFPSLVTDRLLPGDTTESKTVAYTEFATIAAKSVQELKVRHDAELDDLKIRTGDLENRLSEKDAVIAALEARLAALEARLAPSN